MAVDRSWVFLQHPFSVSPIQEHRLLGLATPAPNTPLDFDFAPCLRNGICARDVIDDLDLPTATCPMPFLIQYWTSWILKEGLMCRIKKKLRMLTTDDYNKSGDSTVEVEDMRMMEMRDPYTSMRRLLDTPAWDWPLKDGELGEIHTKGENATVDDQRRSQEVYAREYRNAIFRLLSRAGALAIVVGYLASEHTTHTGHSLQGAPFNGSTVVFACKYMRLEIKYRPQEWSISTKYTPQAIGVLRKDSNDLIQTYEGGREKMWLLSKEILTGYAEMRVRTIEDEESGEVTRVFAPEAGVYRRVVIPLLEGSI